MTFEKRHTAQEHEITPERNLTTKDCSKAAGTADAHNQAYASRRLIFGEVDKSNDSENEEEHAAMGEPGMHLRFIIIITNIYLSFQEINTDENDSDVDNEYEILPPSRVEQTNKINIGGARINLLVDLFHHIRNA